MKFEGMKFRMKFRVNSPEHSVKIQKHLESLGYSWRKPFPLPYQMDKPYLFTDCYGAITYGDGEDWFNNKSCPEMELVEDYSLKVVQPPNRGTVALFGKTFYIDDVVSAIQSLKEV